MKIYDIEEIVEIAQTCTTKKSVIDLKKDYGKDWIFERDELDDEIQWKKDEGLNYKGLQVLKEFMLLKKVKSLKLS